MARTKQRPVAPPIIHPGCRIKIWQGGDWSGKWVTVALAFDTPRNIRQVMERFDEKVVIVRAAYGKRTVRYSEVAGKGSDEPSPDIQWINQEG